MVDKPELTWKWLIFILSFPLYGMVSLMINDVDTKIYLVLYLNAVKPSLGGSERAMYGIMNILCLL